MIRILIVSLLLTSCSRGFVDLVKNEPKVAPIITKNLVVYRPDNFFYSGLDYNVEINGEHKCSLSNGGVMQTDIKPGFILTATNWQLPGTTKIEVNPGDYIKAENRNDIISSGLGLGLVGQIINEGVSSGGPFKFTKMKKEEALQELKGLGQECM